MNTVFIDASAWVALYHKKDNHHKRAWKVYEGLLDEGTKFLTSNSIAYEALSILKSRASYEAAKSLWDILCDSELSRNVHIDRNLEDKSVDLFWKYQDKSWGIVDCSSILLMEQEKCGIAFGYDHHFVQATKQYGFTVL